MTVENTGNIEIDLDVSILPDNPQWAIQVSHGDDQDSRRISLKLGPGQTTDVQFIFGVPLTAEEGDSNEFTFGPNEVSRTDEHHHVGGQR